MLWGLLLMMVGASDFVLKKGFCRFFSTLPFRDSHATLVICSSGHGKTASSSIFLQSLGHEISIIALLRRPPFHSRKKSFFPSRTTFHSQISFCFCKFLSIS